MITSTARWPTNVPARSDVSVIAERRTPPIAGVLLGALALLPIQFIDLPFNLSPLDAWIIITLPLSCWYLIRRRHAIRLPYLAAIWLIMLGSLIGTLAGIDPTASIVAMVKDTYLYAWFVLMTALLSTFDRHQQRTFMRIWVALVVVHGSLVITQFLVPDFYKVSEALASRYGELDRFRPSGLFNNANGTAIYQLLGFIPLVESRLPRIAASTGGMIIVASILATGSLAAAAGFLAGLAVIAAGLIFRRRALLRSLRVLGDVLLLTFLLGLLAYTGAAGRTEVLGDRFQHLFYGRFDQSAAGRLDLWERGTDLLASNTVILGIGPNAYRSIDVMQKTLHNDLLAFAVERGVIGVCGLGLLAALSVGTALQLARRSKMAPTQMETGGLIFLAAVIAVIVESLFHQVFHERAVWLALATSEALWWRLRQEDRDSHAG